jgi:hypothetical protein
MKTFFQFCFFLFCFQINAHTDESNPSGKFDIGFTASPDYSYRFLKTNPSDSWMKSTYDTAEVARIGYTAGLQVVYHHSEKLFFYTGIQFVDRGEKTRTYLTMPVNNYVNHYYYLSIPLRVNYYLIQKKIKLFVSSGLSTDFYLNSKSDIEYRNSGYTKPLGLSSNFSRINVLFNAGVGIDCPVTDRWYFKLQPDFRISLTPAANAAIKKYFYGFAFNMGFFYKF